MVWGVAYYEEKGGIKCYIFMMAMLAACTKYQINEEQSDNNNPFPDYVYNQEKEQGYMGSQIWQ